MTENHREKVSAILRILKNIDKGFVLFHFHMTKSELFHLDIKGKEDPGILEDLQTVALHKQLLNL